MGERAVYYIPSLATPAAMARAFTLDRGGGGGRTPISALFIVLVDGTLRQTPHSMLFFKRN